MQCAGSSNPCQAPSCDPVLGCGLTPVQDGTPCGSVSCELANICLAGTCQAPGCSDGIRNGSESDSDCGGGACRQCLAGQSCRVDADCATKICDMSQKICVGCGDGIKNGAESDVDCGGKLCAACTLGKTCAAHDDCESRLCSSGLCAACQIDNDCPFKICKSGVCSNAPVVGVLGNQTFFMVEVKGAMTDTNVFKACQSAGLNTPCQAMGNCSYNDNLCTMTQESACGNPMQMLAFQLCGKGVSPSSCPALYGCYQYMGHKWTNDSACGAEQNQWCTQGSNQMNRFALCVN